MQNARDEDDDGDPQNTEDGASGVNVPTSFQNPSAQQSDYITGHLDPEPNMSAVVTHQLSTGTSEPDEEPPQDQEDRNEEFIVLDPEHPLVKKFHEDVNTYHSKRLERLQEELKKKRAINKEQQRESQDVGLGLFKTKENLSRTEKKLHDSQHAKSKAGDHLWHAQDELGKAKSKYSDVSGRRRQAKAIVSRLQAKLEKMQQQGTFAQAFSEELHSKVKIMDNARHKVASEKTQAEEEKIKQDFYVERLTKEVENQTQQVAEYELQRRAQAQETQEVTKALSEGELELESLLMIHKKVLQQWNSHIIDIRRRDETVNAMQEAVRAIEDEILLLEREIESYKKSISAEQDTSETVMVELNRSEKGCLTSEKLISQKKMDQEALQAQYSACLHSLSGTKRILATFTNEMSTHQTELNSQRNQIQKLSAARLELEDKIMSHVHQLLTHSKAASYSQHLTTKMSSQKEEKTNQLQVLERQALSVKMESQIVEQLFNNLTLTVETLDEELNKYNNLLASRENAFSSGLQQIKQKETTINTLEKNISKIVESTGQEDLSPLQIRIHKILAEIEEQTSQIKNERCLWMLDLGALVGLSRELEADNKKMRKLQKEDIALQQKEIQLDSQNKQEEREQMELDKNSKLLCKDLEKLCKRKSNSKQLSEAVEQENTQMETDFQNKIKETEQVFVSNQMELENTQEETEDLLKCLLEAKQQIMLWERKTQILKETLEVVDSEINNEEIREMEAEIHRMELQVSELTKQQQRLMREGEKVVEGREKFDTRRDAMLRDRGKDVVTKEKLRRSSKGRQREIQITLEEVADYEQVAKELETSETILSEKILQQKQHLTKLSCTSTKLDNDLVNLQDDKNMNQTYLFAMHNKKKRLQEVCKGSYKLSSSSETVGPAPQSQRERLEVYSNALQRCCEDFPQHQEALQSVTQAAKAHVTVSNIFLKKAMTETDQ